MSVMAMLRQLTIDDFALSIMARCPTSGFQAGGRDERVINLAAALAKGL
jgi:hypothetical protein